MAGLRTRDGDGIAHSNAGRGGRLSLAGLPVYRSFGVGISNQLIVGGHVEGHFAEHFGDH
ncbi:hypothetical protein AWB79_01591 [Caballeronia hypogeia]|uniref:Uncharacterized protein n=1 Tax=Caballeronia hypogeia TaxID=1777140 RepID=A0A157ZY02_9BURK|nr:hypothetical protein AWB79_01591 [Caballeronia hypogeia]